MSWNRTRLDLRSKPSLGLKLNFAFLNMGNRNSFQNCKFFKGYNVRSHANLYTLGHFNFVLLNVR